MADNLFSQLDKLGLGNLQNLQLYEDPKKAEEEAKTEKVEKVYEESDFVFDKTYKCPVCEAEFKSKAVRTGKAKLLDIDMDLRPKYQGVDALKYDCIVCTKCGYASLSRFFNYVNSRQAKSISELISKSYKEDTTVYDTYSYEDAITRHQLALANAVVKNSKPSEKAYICLKLAWLLRGKAENLPETENDREKVIKQLGEAELQYIKNAYEGFKSAYSEEAMPICGMDQWTFMYLLSDLARRCEDYSMCLKLVSELLVSKGASDKLKDRAREVRKLIKEKL